MMLLSNYWRYLDVYLALLLSWNKVQHFIPNHLNLKFYIIETV